MTTQILYCQSCQTTNGMDDDTHMYCEPGIIDLIAERERLLGIISDIAQTAALEAGPQLLAMSCAICAFPNCKHITQRAE